MDERYPTATIRRTTRKNATILQATVATVAADTGISGASSLLLVILVALLIMEAILRNGSVWKVESRCQGTLIVESKLEVDNRGKKRMMAEQDKPPRRIYGR